MPGSADAFVGCCCNVCCFGVLGLDLSASREEIVRSWRQLLLRHHPDKSDSAEADAVAKLLNRAKDQGLAALVSFDCVLARSYRARGRESELCALRSRVRCAGIEAPSLCVDHSPPCSSTVERPVRRRGPHKHRWPGVIF